MIGSTGSRDQKGDAGKMVQTLTRETGNSVRRRVMMDVTLVSLRYALMLAIKNGLYILVI